MKTANGSFNENLRMAEMVWGLDWEKHLPAKLGEFELVLSSFEEYITLKNSHNSFLITSDVTNDSFVKDIGSHSKDNYLKNVSDFFVFKKDGKIVGITVCEIRDWTTYYLRYIFIDPKFRSNDLTVLFVKEVENILMLYPVDKIVCDVAPGNLRQVSRMSSAGYVYTGSVLCERFGANLRLTRFLSEDSWKVFNSNFSQMYYQRKEDKSNEAFEKPKRSIYEKEIRT